jgi:4-hydroxy-tetrahydrodipicolinate reductase
MGRALLESAAGQEGLAVTSLWARSAESARGVGAEDHVLVSADLDAVLAAADVLVDFSLPEANERVVAAVLEHAKPLVCGVSGLDAQEQERLRRAGGRVGVVYDRNMSLGIAVLDGLVRQAAAALGENFEITVQESHHLHKRDAPSGTALKLGESIAGALGREFADVCFYDPDGSGGEAPPGAIRFEVERRGDIPGDHTVSLTSATERLTLGHSVTTRRVFADGALRAARWVAGQPPGLYSMRQVLFGVEGLP